MKKASLLLLTSLTISLIWPIAAIPSEPVSRLTTLKKSLNNNFKEFIKCVKGDTDCDPQKQKFIRQAFIAVGILASIIVTGKVIHTLKKIHDLHTIIFNGHHHKSYNIEAINKILNTGIDANARDLDGDTPLLSLLKYNMSWWEPDATKERRDSVKAVVQLFINRGADVNAQAKYITQTPLSLAARNGQTEIAALLIEHGAHVNHKVKNPSSYIENETPLHEAIRNNHIETAQLLIENGADTNSKNNVGKTPLNVVKLDSHIIAKLLKKSGTQ